MHHLSLDEFLIITIFIGIIAAIILFFRKRSPLKYKKVSSIFTSAEKRFYTYLVRAIGDEYYVFAKVRMADIILPVSAKDRSRWQSAFNKVACKHVDYLLCDKELKIVAAIELDDASHEQKKRVQRDVFVEWAFKSAKVPLIRFVLKKHYDSALIRKEILTALRG